MGWFIAAGLVLSAAWFMADMRWFTAWNTQVSELAAAGRYGELPGHHQRALRSLRPLVVLIRRVFFPGQLEAQFALHLHMMGDNQGALDVLTAVLPRLQGRGKFEATARAVMTMALGGMGRMEEAEAEWQRLARVVGAPPSLMVAGAQVALWDARWLDALQRAQAVLDAEPADEGAHLVAAAALSELGRLEEALKMADHDPRPLTAFHSASNLATLAQDPNGRRLLDAQERERAQVTRPSPLLQCAAIYLEMEDLHAAGVYLHRAEDVLGTNPVIATNFHFMKAMVLAAQGDASGGHDHMVRAEQAAQHVAGHTALLAEMKLAFARAALSLGESEPGLAHAQEALRATTHPATRMMAHFWVAEALVAVGRPQQAEAHYTAAAAAPQGGRLAQKAQARLDALSPQP